MAAGGRLRLSARRVFLLAALAGAILLGTAVPAGAAPAPAGEPPPGFFGVVPQGPLSTADLERMEGTVETLRIPIYWTNCEPRPGEFDFSVPDAEIAAAAARGIQVMPFVYGTPSWLAAKPAIPPTSGPALAAWEEFLGKLVERYGSAGTLWEEVPRSRPILRWQIWNEPNFVLFWAPKPSPEGYARLLRRSARTIRAADPRAKIVMAGVAPVGAGTKPSLFVRQLLRRPGVRGSFDFAALHPYSSNMGELNYQLQLMRSALAAGGADRKPLLVTEIGVASGGFVRSVFVKGISGQAHYLRRAYGRLLEMRRRWHIAGIDWFTWEDASAPDRYCSFCQGAGLLDVSGQPKPAWEAFRQVVATARGGRATRPIN
jgi:polysaccharide biosynthesis protein PslG